MSDLRFAVRMLRKSPAFTLVTAGLLSLGIGASSLMFSAFESVWLRRLPVRQPGELVRMVQRTPPLGTRSSFFYPYYRALSQRATTLAAVFGELEIMAPMNQPAPAEQVRVHLATPEFFQVLGADALYGRALTPEDSRDSPGAPPAVLSYGFWQRRFQSNPAALGKSLTLKGHAFTIVGVMPAAFNGISADNSPDVRLPLRALPLLATQEYESNLDNITLDLGGRLKPGVTRQRARDECYAIWAAALKDWYSRRGFKPGDVSFELNHGMDLDPLERGVSILRDKYGSALQWLTIAVGLLLLMVCTNVAGLLLARAAGRRGEIAVRLALGATRARLVRQMLIESLLLAGLGAAGGWLLAWTAAPLLLHALPPVRDLGTAPVALSLSLAPDARVILVSLAAALLTALLFGLAPALSASRTSLDAILRGTRSSRRWEGRRVLVVFQVALCTLLLSGAGLLVRTFYELRSLDPGFDQDHVITFTVYPGLSGYTAAQTTSFWSALTTRVRQIPGVASASAASRAVMRGSGVKSTVAPAGQKPPRSDFLNTSINNVLPDYFETMGMAILQGRALTPADVKASKPVPTVVNMAFVRRFFPDGNALGGRFGNALDSVAPASYEIVGIVRDAKYRSLREPMTPTYYSATDSGLSVLCVRTYQAPESIVQDVRKALAGLDAGLPFTEIHSLLEEVEASAAPERLTAVLTVVFGLFATLLAAVGLYGLLAFAVERRRREIGIRMALGARPVDIAATLGIEALLTVASGVVVGLLAALELGQLVRALLYGVSPVDPLSLAVTAILVIAIAAAATAIPTVRAVRVLPSSALRQE